MTLDDQVAAYIDAEYPNADPASRDKIIRDVLVRLRRDLALKKLGMTLSQLRDGCRIALASMLERLDLEERDAMAAQGIGRDIIEGRQQKIGALRARETDAMIDTVLASDWGWEALGNGDGPFSIQCTMMPPRVLN